MRKAIQQSKMVLANEEKENHSAPAPLANGHSMEVATGTIALELPEQIVSFFGTSEV